MFLFFLQGMNTLGIGTSEIGVATSFQGSSFFINPASLAGEQKALTFSIDYNSLHQKYFSVTDTSPDLFKGGLILGLDPDQNWQMGGIVAATMKGTGLGLKALFDKRGILSFQTGFLTILTQRLSLGGKFYWGPDWSFIHFQGGLTMNWEKVFFLGLDGLYDGQKVFRLGGHFLYILQQNLALLGGVKSAFNQDVQASFGLQLNYKIFLLTGAYQRDFFLKKDLFSVHIGFSWMR